MCAWEGIKPRTNARDPGPKSGTKFCQPNMGTKHAYIKLKFTSKVDYLTLLINAYHDLLSFLIFFSNSIEIRNHVKPFRPGTSFGSIHDVKHFSIFVQINVINAKFLIICHLVRHHRL